MSNLQAAIGCAQLAKADGVIEKKRELADFYNNALSDMPDLQLPVEKPYAKNVYWMYHVVLRGALQGKREKIMRALAERGVETREAFVPANMQEIFIKRGLTAAGDCPVANYAAENGFYLPSGPILSEEERSHVVRSLKDAVKNV
ncbi:MAG: DegT/DnrJ/EryC1/StrS family aminotransferase, partial [Patescibacteria group bacterium]